MNIPYRKITCGDELLPNETYWQACHHWNQYWGQKAGNIRNGFIELTGQPMMAAFDEEAELSPEVGRLIRLMAGPHWKTVIKAYLIRHPNPKWK